jgi:hypothetical protein
VRTSETSPLSLRQTALPSPWIRFSPRIGAEIARMFAREGADVAIADSNEHGVQSIGAEIGNSELAVKCDVSVATDVSKSVEAARSPSAVSILPSTMLVQCRLVPPAQLYLERHEKPQPGADPRS